MDSYFEGSNDVSTTKKKVFGCEGDDDAGYECINTATYNVGVSVQRRELRNHAMFMLVVLNRV